MARYVVINHNQQITTIKATVRANIANTVRDMRSNRDLENWVSQLVNDRFAELNAAMDRECENLFQETESTMVKIQNDHALNEAERTIVLYTLEKVETRCHELMRTLDPIYDKAKRALKVSA